MTAPPTLLLTEREAAKALAICERTLFTLRTSGEIPHVKIGRSIRYYVADLHRWIAEKKTTGVDT